MHPTSSPSGSPDAATSTVATTDNPPPLGLVDRLCRRARFVTLAVILLLAAHAGLLAYSATRHSPTMLEPGFLAAGLSHWEFGRFELFRVNPPLVRMVAALPVLAAGYEADWSGFYEGPGARPEFSMGADFVRANGERSIWLFTIARWACLPFSLVGGLFCFLWARDLWQHNGAGLIALTLWCFEPNILAHGELITTDAAATSLGLGAGYLFWRWLRQPGWERAGWMGLMLGLAQLTKSTWLVLFGLWPLLWLLYRHFQPRRDADSAESPGSLPAQILQLAAALLLGLYVLNLGYAYDGTFTRLQDYTFVSTSFTGLEEPGEPGNRFAESWPGHIPVPLPQQYLLGVDLQKKDFEDYSQPSYLRGEWKEGGWWYYYLYGLAVKTPHGTQLMLLLAILTLFLRRGQPERAAGAGDMLVLLTPAVVVMVLVSAQLEFNHHLRYVLPVFGFTFVFCGVTIRWFETQPVPGSVDAPPSTQ
ncbi:hypothetical protein Mal4_39100 [Maioricimonas rarisocia]|uniref:Glycosyltransferase RgtA/B/C/D-like domain-containing protein n=1 Tax=Maioricimonas rarisocia TaxID=2528026 RepID=A0A517ZAN1_9PLAN|nr:glycosyltransferase family 39 protein [Maioricimonas rarisocia]QDU39565.1 hypothetical protein Mal4_39100 [Maioricimonas rarisocia]